MAKAAARRGRCLESAVDEGREPHENEHAEVQPQPELDHLRAHAPQMGGGATRSAGARRVCGATRLPLARVDSTLGTERAERGADAQVHDDIRTEGEHQRDVEHAELRPVGARPRRPRAASDPAPVCVLRRGGAELGTHGHCEGHGEW